MFAIGCPVSPDEPEPTATTVFESPSPKFQVYCCVAEKAEFAPGFVAVLFVNVTGNPDVDSSLIPLTTPPAAEYAAVCAEYTSKLFVAVCGYVDASAVGCVSNLNLIAYLVSPVPVPSTVDPSSPAVLVNV